MIRAVGQEAGDWFSRAVIPNFPCADLRTIDGLWVKYSQGKFGFSVQKKIYVECGAKLDGEYPGDKIWDKFCDRVGWRKGGIMGGKEIKYADLKANPSLSPAGEFPRFIFYRQYFYVEKLAGGGEWFVKSLFNSLFSHTDL